jgi:hypothetical protein
MKSPLWIVLTSLVVLVAGMVYLNRQKAPPPPESVAALSSGKSTARPISTAVPAEKPSRVVPHIEVEPVRDSVPSPVSSDATMDGPGDQAPTATLLSEAIATLVSPHTCFQQKEQAWRQLIESGQLDQAIEALAQGAVENPTLAEYPATLGQAQLRKAGVIAQSGGRISDMGMLGMQADQNFDQALTLDPANWEAQFFKAVAMSHWPLELNKGEEVIQRLSSLIDQQDTLTPQPQFAQTYVVLGDQYQKLGEPDYAVATWQIGAQKFPSNLALQQRARGH